MTFKDHFSRHSGEYSRFRPSYPKRLADFLAGVSPRRGTVWEAGCGSGQLTTLLADRFERVLATDASEEQLANAPVLPNVEYRCVRAEDSGLPSRTADLCVAAQAAHWFDLDAYYTEVRRVGRTGSVVALVTYTLMQVNDSVDEIIRTFYASELADYWPPERRFVETGYADLPFPFEEMDAPAFEMSEEWSLPQLLGYVRSWSGVRALLENAGSRTFDVLEEDLAAEWGESEVRQVIRWPLAMRLGRIAPE